MLFSSYVQTTANTTPGDLLGSVASLSKFSACLAAIKVDGNVAL
jgi:hypothetical protein